MKEQRTGESRTLLKNYCVECLELGYRFAFYFEQKRQCLGEDIKLLVIPITHFVEIFILNYYTVPGEITLFVQ